MKISAKALSLALAAAMMLTVCACNTKPSRSGIRQADEPSKPEGTISTMPDPGVTTAPPDPTMTQPTDPSDTVPAGPVEFTVSDLMYVSELCIGLGPDQAEEFLASVLALSDYTVVTDSGSGTSGVPGERFLRNLDRDIIVAGIAFKSIGILCNDNDVVVSVNYTVRERSLFEVNEVFDSETAYNTLYPLFCGAYGDPSDEYSSSWVDFDKSGSYGWKYEQYWVSLFWGMSCQSVPGNDQLVIGIEHENSSSLLNGGGATTRHVSSTYNDIYQLMDNVIGLDLDSAKIMINNAFGIDIGNAVSSTDDGSGPVIYTYDADISFDGFSFNLIELDTNKDNIVYHIGFTNNTDEADKLRDDCIELKDLTADYLESEPTLEFPLDDDNQIIEFYDFKSEKGNVITIGAYFTDYYNSFWFSCENAALGI